MSETAPCKGLDAADCTALSGLLADLAGCGPDLPLIAPVLLLGQPELAAAARALRAPQGLSALHESQRIERLGPLPLDQPLTLRHAGQAGDFWLEMDGPDGPAVRLETRIRFALPEQMQGLKGARFTDRMAGAGTRWARAAPLDATVIARYLDLSRDDNPIHRDAAAAMAGGFPGVVVPGMLMAGLAECAAYSAETKTQSLAVRFMASVPVDTALDMAVVPRGAGARVFTLLPDRTIAAITDLA